MGKLMEKKTRMKVRKKTQQKSLAVAGFKLAFCVDDGGEDDDAIARTLQRSARVPRNLVANGLFSSCSEGLGNGEVADPVAVLSEEDIWAQKWDEEDDVALSSAKALSLVEETTFYSFDDRSVASMKVLSLMLTVLRKLLHGEDVEDVEKIVKKRKTSRCRLCMYS